MKNIYTWRIHDDYVRYWTKDSIEHIGGEDKAYWEKFDIAELYLSKDSNPKDLDKWEPPIIKEEIEEDEGILKKGDFHSVWGYESYIVSQNMVDKIGDILREYGELFPLEVEDREDKLYRYWVTKEIPFDCVDKKKSKIFQNKYEDDYVFKIEKLILKEECEDVPMIFRVKEMREKNIFVTDDFIELVKKHNLKGFDFEPDTSYEYDGPTIKVG